jgi:hypothetical protein
LSAFSTGLVAIVCIIRDDLLSLEVGTTIRLLLQDELITALSYRDKSASADKAYEYSLEAVDTHGNESVAVMATAEKW